MNFKIIASCGLALGMLASGALSVTRENDELSVIMPSENQMVVGMVDVDWLVRDADQVEIPIQLDVFSLSCSNNGEYYATVTDNADAYTYKGANVFGYAWDTMGQLKNKASIGDGDYCLRVCATLLRDNNYYYSLCDTRTVSIQNNNRKPVILSTPSKLDYLKGDDFAYQINANDPDGDTITYSMVSGPSFIAVNSVTGLVSSTGKLAQTGSFIIKLRVTDNKTAYAEQIITINVSESSTRYNLVVVAPALGAVIKTDNTEVRWSIDTTTGISGFVVYYSKDAETWERVGTAAASNSTFMWDISDISGGDYYIKVEATKTTGTSTSAISGKFSIDKTGGSIPLILSVKPAEDSSMAEKRPEIEAVFTLNDGGSLNKQQTLMSLDDAVITDCVKTDNSISCTLSSDLEIGRHKAKVVVLDNLNKSNTKEWFFDVTADSTDNNSATTNGVDMEFVKNMGIVVCAGLFVIAFILLGIYWLNRLRRKATTDEYTGGSEISQDNQLGTYAVSDYQQTDVQNFQNAPDVTVNPPLTPEYGYTPTLSYDVTTNQDSNTQVATTPPQFINTSTDTIQMPSSYTSDEIPDWLKSSDADKPVSVQDGQVQDYNANDANNSIDNASQPHE